MQYFFQAWGSRGPAKYRDMLLNSATEEISHIEMLATAVALNLEKTPASIQEKMAADPIAGAVMNGMDMRHILSNGLAAMPSDSNGVPFDMSHIYASENIARDMYCNVAAEATDRVLAVGCTTRRTIEYEEDARLQQACGVVLVVLVITLRFECLGRVKDVVHIVVPLCGERAGLTVAVSIKPRRLVVFFL